MNRTVCVVGMHRSGTSCLAGSLEEAGLHLGEVATIGRHNAKGNRENTRIMALHEAVLDHSGGSWNHPPGQANWSDAHAVQRDAIIRSYADVTIWGFKDPRSLLLLDFWRAALPSLTVVGTLRHPRLVAESLYRRGGGSMDDWLELWADYNARMLAHYQADPFPIVRFDLGEESYRRSLAVVIGQLDLAMPPRMGFFDPMLRHHATASTDGLPARIGDLYSALCRIALSA